MALSMPALKKKRDDYVKRLNGIYKNNLGNSDVDFVEGDASFVSANVVQAAGKTYTAPNVLIAVGGKPRMPEMPGIEHAISSDGFFELEEVPKKVAVIGNNLNGRKKNKWVVLPGAHIRHPGPHPKRGLPT